jgi:hypothetical protein
MSELLCPLCTRQMQNFLKSACGALGLPQNSSPSHVLAALNASA